MFEFLLKILNFSKIWWIAIRPNTLWVSLCPIMVVTALCYNRLSVVNILLSLLGILSLQIGANLTNDYYDTINGADNADRVGPLRVMQAKLVSESAMRKAIMFVYTIAFFVGVHFGVYIHSFLFILMSVSICASYLYTGGSKPYAYYGLGDPMAFLFFGPIAVASAFYIQTYEISLFAIYIGIAIGCFSISLITANNWRDIEGDRRAGKKTLAVFFGPRFSRFEYIFFIFLPYIIFIHVLYLRDVSLGLSLLTLSCLGITWYSTLKEIWVFDRIELDHLKNLLKKTGKAFLIYSIYLSFILFRTK
ncbi:1,4-dihydroxy-2-naphthoate octaprenyltransferase [PVC group bacterium (ex Bugula neritina AB1)]|nr:1,4-dihydroxy-2-naphthoate octaprenyltransferase [PVC group bacterium (ex Bugula neritina AB1)]